MLVVGPTGGIVIEPDIVLVVWPSDGFVGGVVCVGIRVCGLKGPTRVVGVAPL